MILDMIVWGFFSAWGWFGANYIKEKTWPDTPPAQVQPAEKTNESARRRNEESEKQNP